ncbi:MAG: TonB family protein [Bacteroidales bacterium]|nr:TonB family protein [Bacteroidales bacterium]
MNHGKKTCDQLKAIRQQIADANEIDYKPHECTFEGECRGTCPACEGEMRYIERELQHRQSLGKKIAVVGIATGVSAVATVAQNVATTQNDSISVEDIDVQGDLEYFDDEPSDTLLIAEKMPIFPGGDEVLRKYLAESIRIPAISGEINVQGRVFVNFVINKEGYVTNVKVARPFDPPLDAEVVRVVKSMPRWTPGMQNGKPVNIRYIVPINILLQ